MRTKIAFVTGDDGPEPDDPPQVRRAARRLLDAGFDRDGYVDALERLSLPPPIRWGR